MKTVVLLSKVFFEGHQKAGQPNNFAKSVKDGCKRHTVRSNYAYWEKKIAALKSKAERFAYANGAESHIEANRKQF